MPLKTGVNSKSAFWFMKLFSVINQATHLFNSDPNVPVLTLLLTYNTGSSLTPLFPQQYLSPVVLSYRWQVLQPTAPIGLCYKLSTDFYTQTQPLPQRPSLCHGLSAIGCHLVNRQDLISWILTCFL